MHISPSALIRYYLSCYRFGIMPGNAANGEPQVAYRLYVYRYGATSQVFSAHYHPAIRAQALLRIASQIGYTLS